MPELPEVETVKKGLIKKVKGLTITDCKVLWPGIIAYPKKEEFIKRNMFGKRMTKYANDSLGEYISLCKKVMPFIVIIRKILHFQKAIIRD